MKIIGKEYTKIWLSPKRYYSIDKGFRKHYYIVIKGSIVQHRKNGPAYIDSISMEWYFHDYIHRSNGPADFLKGKETLWHFKNENLCEETYWNM
ncbi:MAG: hypothetical protein AABY22_27730 [Nanoarchaeota archaeon]